MQNKLLFKEFYIYYQVLTLIPVILHNFSFVMYPCMNNAKR